MSGKVIYDGFKQVEKDVSRILEQENIEKGMTGTIRLGIFENQIIDEYLQEILNDFSKRRYQNVELYVTTDSFNGLINSVMDGKLDCAATIGYDL
ncbi:MAG: hypothetical protein V8R80_00295 [Eubacterium sp.]